MNLLYTEVEDDLRASVRDMLADRCPADAVLARVESAQPVDLELWRLLEPGLAVPESLGGQGASARELSVVCEELGRSIAPVPFLGSAILATEALLASGAAQVRALADGSRIGALAVPLTTAAGSAFPDTVRATAGHTLSGTVGSVADAAVADILVVPAVGQDGPALYLTEAAQVSPLLALDLTRGIADVTCTGAPATLVASGDAAVSALRSALVFGAGMLAAEQLGIAEWCLDTTVNYLRERYQFARPVGSFQALKHRLADLWVELITARAAVRYAADCLTSGEDVEIAVAVAAAQCGELAVHAAEEALQLHGGIGMTWEHPVHLYLKRAKANELALGTPEAHRNALAGLIDIA